MAKPVLKFTAVPYEIGNHTGYRPQLEQQKPVSDLDFCREVVTEKRLSMSAEELLHALEMVGEVGPQKVAEDGRPRAVTKLLKWNRYAQGKLESPTSPWNGTCRAVIRAQLLFDAEKLIDASFQNVNSGIGVRLDNVTWIGAKSVQNVIKIGTDFAAYGRHMEFIADGEKPDTAWLEMENGETFDLANKASDVSSATFGFPAALAGVEPGTQVTFWMKSRGGVADGQVYTSKKVVTVLAGDPTPPPTVDHAYSDGDGSTDNWAIGATNGCLNGAHLAGAAVAVEVLKTGETDWEPCEATVTKADEGLIRLTLAQSGGAMMAEKLRFTVTTPGGSAVKVLESFT